MAYLLRDGNEIHWLINIKGLIVGIFDRISYFDFYLINISKADLIREKFH